MEGSGDSEGRVVSQEQVRSRVSSVRIVSTVSVGVED